MCLETKFTEFNCGSCADGHMCYDCRGYDDWFTYLPRPRLDLLLRCPVCYKKNWNFLYNHFVEEFPELAYYDWNLPKFQKPVFQILWRNMDME